MNTDRLMKFVTPYGKGHPLLVARVRVGVGVWLLILTAILYGSGRDGWWALLLVPVAALHFYLAYCVPRAISAQTHSPRAR
jgi:hypothetical protein